MKGFFIGRIILILLILYVVAPVPVFAEAECGSITRDFDNEATTTPIQDCEHPFGVLVPNDNLEVRLDDAILISGNSYPVLNQGPQEITITGSEEQVVYGSLYFHNGQDYEHEEDVSTDNPTYAFTKPGTYTLVIFEYSVFQVRNTLFQKVKDFLIPTAFASFSEPSRIITFTVTEPVPEGSGVSNILFIPGMEGSRLYVDDAGEEERLWEPGGRDEVARLKMTSTGRSIEDIYTKDIIDEKLGIAVGGNIYKSFLEHLNTLDEDTQYQITVGIFPYDWRYDVFDVVGTGIRNNDGSYISTLDAITYLATTSITGKVTLIAHSNGGLLAKAILMKLEREGKTDLIDKIIFIATPHLGTPKGIMALLHGFDQSLGYGIFARDLDIRSVMQNMPGVYGLLPSEAYMNIAGEPMITFDTSTSTKIYRNRYGTAISNLDEYLEFLTGEEGRESSPLEIQQPIKANESMALNALFRHQFWLDSWKPPDGIEVFNIIGTGLPTPKSIEYRGFTQVECLAPGACLPKEDVLEPVIHFTHYGDETVVSKSVSFTGNGKNLYADLSLIERHDHVDITEANEIQLVIDRVLNGSSTQDIDFISETEPVFNTNTDIITIHSPARIYVQDAKGNITGRTEVGNEWRTEIAGSDYFEAGDVKYVLVPSELSYEVVIEGEGEGVFSHEVKRLKGNTEVPQHSFTASITPETVVRYAKVEDEYGKVTIDTDGDGVIDIQMYPDGTIINVGYTYSDLRKAIEALNLPKMDKRALVILVNKAEKLSQKNKKRTNRVMEKAVLGVIQNAIDRYRRSGLISEVERQYIHKIISQLMK